LEPSLDIFIFGNIIPKYIKTFIVMSLTIEIISALSGPTPTPENPVTQDEMSLNSQINSSGFAAALSQA
jgi:hypothetical protein